MRRIPFVRCYKQIAVKGRKCTESDTKSKTSTLLQANAVSNQYWSKRSDIQGSYKKLQRGLKPVSVYCKRLWEFLIIAFRYNIWILLRGQKTIGLRNIQYIPGRQRYHQKSLGWKASCATFWEAFSTYSSHGIKCRTYFLSCHQPEHNMIHHTLYSE
jgi:hypothetical protein